MANYPIIRDANYRPEPDGSAIHGQILLDTGEALIVFTQVDDGALVFQIDTDANGRRIRICLNEAVLFDGNPEEE